MLKQTWQAGWKISRIMTIFCAISAGLVALSLGGLLLDSRTVLGQPNWLKMFKFSVSFVLYAPSMLWAYSFILDRWPRLVRRLLDISAILLMAEIVLIMIQTVRATPSHFNIGTPFDTAIWVAMGNSIGFFYIVSMIGAVLLLRQRFATPSLQWSVRLGVGLMLLGFGLGFLMTTPNAEQLDAIKAGNPGMAGAHTVGAADGGETMAVTGWSTEGGDLRIAHFIGIHGMQALALLGLWLQTLRGWREGQRLAMVWTGAVAYLGLTGLVTWQALRGQPLLQPDALTLGALAVLIVGTVLATLAIRARRSMAQLAA